MALLPSYLIIFFLQGVLVATSMWVHLRCIIDVPVGFCEVKYRRLRRGRGHYEALVAGRNFIWPLLQRRIARGNLKGMLFPVSRDAIAPQSTGDVAAHTNGGTHSLLVRASYIYHVDDIVKFMRDEVTAVTPPSEMAHIRAQAMLKEAITKVHITEATLHAAPSAIAAVFAATADKHNRGSALIVELVGMQRCTQLTDIPLGNGKRAAA